ncbi:MAG: chromate efflux transporter [Acinetobacter sp.]
MKSISAWQIFWVFLRLGCTSFGGPAAHLVFFHQLFIQKKQWLSEAEYARILALAQLLPGPTSSQAGIGIGYLIKGYSGAFAAWLGFSLPSALLMAMAAIAGQQYFQLLNSQSFHLIQLIVLAVICHAFWQMFQSFCSAFWQKLLMFCIAVLTLYFPISGAHIVLLSIAGLIGYFFECYRKRNICNTLPAPAESSMARQQITQSLFWFSLFLLPFIFFAALPSSMHGAWQNAFQFYQSASMVFGGGHVVLPLMYQDFVLSQQISAENFNAGYALAQLMPGPLFSFASYIGAFLEISPWPWLNAFIATAAIFLPSFLLMFAAMPCWSWLMQQQALRAAVTGMNAAVAGLLFAMILHMGHDYLLQFSDLCFVIALLCLLRTKLPIWLILIGGFMGYSTLFNLL